MVHGRAHYFPNVQKLMPEPETSVLMNESDGLLLVNVANYTEPPEEYELI